MSRKRIAILGGGPIGLEAALEAARRGNEVVVYEAGRVGEHLLQFGHVPLFTPFGMNSTPQGRQRLENEGGKLPAEDVLLPASALVERYLAPLSRLPELRGAIRENARVTHVGREGIPKPRATTEAGDRSRSGCAFRLRVASADGRTRFERADVVIDASGVYGSANATGSGGIPAIGEDDLGDRIDRHVPSILGSARARFEKRRVLLVGDGHSAATALLELESLAAAAGSASPVVHWVRRDRGTEAPFIEIPGDPLPARRELTARANAISRTARWLVQHPGVTVDRYQVDGDTVHVSLGDASGAERAIEVDRVLALVGYRPDTALCRELQVHLCYASEGPMKLAAAILAAGLASPDRAGDCLAQTTHGPETLRNPEPDFYILGAKSYGRNQTFLLSIGHRQIEEVFSLMEPAEAPLQSVAPSTSR